MSKPSDRVVLDTSDARDCRPHPDDATEAPGVHSASAAQLDRLLEIVRLKERIAELEAAVAARDDFLAVAAHELRNPMTPILGQVERLQRIVAEDSFSPNQIRSIVGLTDQLVRLFIKRATILLDVSRMTSGKLKLRVEDFDVGELVRRVVKAHEAAAAHAGSELTYVERGVLQVSLDPLAVEQILDNILLNALRYGGGRPVIVTADGKDRHVTLVVRDHGTGISQSDRERIFARFEQAVSSPSQGGFGIGLWVVGQLVQAMGGEIEVDTALNEGSSFKVTLPRLISQDR